MSRYHIPDFDAAPEPTGPTAMEDAALDSVQGGVALLLPAVQAARESANAPARPPMLRYALKPIRLARR